MEHRIHACPIPFTANRHLMIKLNCLTLYNHTGRSADAWPGPTPEKIVKQIRELSKE